ncbi:methyl-viologen-reducing hydrogenase delta subunit [Desulfovibrio sp. X2]|uniref:hydrogenase iron-sulfur subunit n=1 Tax=Desulfovibrio sp. X2 TaxID=941449 RepID=UPI000358C96D|nr:hydrogenase iron-sulfur subunit [Desulfovibrio sp. X2]EPR44425.1 methyl-viologen-reducing hydrogenase delta subunit [Desulfovibrio sp. X2]
MPEKIGVYIDESCLGSVLSAEPLVEFVKNRFSKEVSVVRSHPRLSSVDGQKLIQADIDAGDVDAVCICGTSPRYDSDLFSFTGDALVDRVNLREFVAKAYKNPDGSVPKAGDAVPEELRLMVEDYLKMGVLKLTKMAAPAPEIPEGVKTILVLGGGWTGLNAAQAATTAGFDVVLVEKSDQLGGKALNLFKSFPLSAPWTQTEDTGIAALAQAVQSNPKVKVYLGKTLEKLEGAPGMYQATIGGENVAVGSVVLATGFDPQDGKYLEPLGYGKLKNIVTTREFEKLAKDGLKAKRVAFIADIGVCMEQGLAAEAAQAEADLAAAEAAKDAPKEEKAEGEEKTVVFKDLESCKHLAFSSELNSLVALKQAGYVADSAPDAMGYVFYDHMMVPGINERYYKAAQDKPGVMLTKGRITGIREEGSGLVVLAQDTLLGESVELAVDMVVLPTGMVPTTAHGPVVNFAYRQGPAFPDLELFSGFADSNYICFPYETRRTGVYAAGCVRQPMSMAMSREDANGAVLKAIQCISSLNRGVSVHPRSGDKSYPKFNFVRCTQCKRCTEECPFGALDDDPKGTPMPNPTRCRRCGTCMGACPERVISFDNYNVDMIGTMIKSVEIPPKIDEGGPRAIILACENDAYPALDIAAMRGSRWSPYVRIVPVRCLGSVNTIWIADAMSKGTDGVLLLGCKYGEDYQCHFVKGSELCSRRMVNVAESLNRLGVEPERVVQKQVAIDEYDQVPLIIDEFMNYILKLGPNPFKGY